MACYSGQVTLTSEPALIADTDGDGAGGCRVIIKSIDKRVYIGCQNVTPETGFSINKDEEQCIPLGPEDEIWGLCDNGDAVVQWFKSMR